VAIEYEDRGASRRAEQSAQSGCDHEEHCIQPVCQLFRPDRISAAACWVLGESVPSSIRISVDGGLSDLQARGYDEP